MPKDNELLSATDPVKVRALKDHQLDGVSHSAGAAYKLPRHVARNLESAGLVKMEPASGAKRASPVKANKARTPVAENKAK